MKQEKQVVKIVKQAHITQIQEEHQHVQTNAQKVNVLMRVQAVALVFIIYLNMVKVLGRAQEQLAEQVMFIHVLLGIDVENAQ